MQKKNNNFGQEHQQVIQMVNSVSLPYCNANPSSKNNKNNFYSPRLRIWSLIFSFIPSMQKNNNYFASSGPEYQHVIQMVNNVSLPYCNANPSSKNNKNNFYSLRLRIWNLIFSFILSMQNNNNNSASSVQEHQHVIQMVNSVSLPYFNANPSSKNNKNKRTLACHSDGQQCLFPELKGGMSIQ